MSNNRSRSTEAILADLCIDIVDKREGFGSETDQYPDLISLMMDADTRKSRERRRRLEEERAQQSKENFWYKLWDWLSSPFNR